MSVGYSGTPLIKKLGIKAGMRLLWISAPAHYGDLLGDLPPDATLLDTIPNDHSVDFIHVFCRMRDDLENALPDLLTALAWDGMLWVSWYKKAAKIPTDITEDVVREVALPRGMVDVKVAAVDAQWSGLKLVYRKAVRPPTPSP